MNAPNSPQGRPSEDEHDPTGMRELLASLPDPGPMPDDVMQNIQSALAEEQQQRSGDHANVSPLLNRTSESGESRPRERSGAARWLRPLAAVGAAAAVGIGALAGYQSLSGSDAAPVANPPNASSDGGGQDAIDRLKSRVSIQQSGRDYTRRGLATQAAALKHPAGAGKPQPSASEDGGAPLLSRAGLVSCVQDVIGGGVPDRISADLGQYEGEPAVIVVVTDKGKSTAWVVSRTCQNAKGKIAGPTAVA